MNSINIVISDQYYLKDPQSSNLGKSIILEGIKLLEDLGYEDFTFKKLAKKIGSTEASIYRYFKNKLKFLVYISTWYWAWLEYMIDFETHHMSDSIAKLKAIIKLICHNNNKSSYEEVHTGMNITLIKQIIGAESDKTYLTKRVDEINSKGLFTGYKNLCKKITEVVIAINPKYKYPNSLVSMIMESSHQQIFFAQHLPSLTDVCIKGESSIESQNSSFIEHTIMNSLKK